MKLDKTIKILGYENVTGGSTFPVTALMNVFPGVFHIRNGLAVFLIKLMRILSKKYDETIVNKMDKEKRDKLEADNLRNTLNREERYFKMIKEYENKVYCSK